MTKQRLSFSAEFKREGAGLVLDHGHSHMEASGSLGVVESALCRWVPIPAGAQRRYSAK